jgi:hypothetical protein
LEYQSIKIAFDNDKDCGSPRYWVISTAYLNKQANSFVHIESALDFLSAIALLRKLDESTTFVSPEHGSAIAKDK